MEFKDIALIYGGELIGKGVDMGIDTVIPVQARMAKIALAAILPLLTLTNMLQRNEKAQTIVLLTGAYLSTQA